MSEKPHIGKFRRSWRKLFGEPPDLKELIQQLAGAEERCKQLDEELEKVREERLGWRAKESSTRKELQDCQERAEELLEQVVQLTHKQRSTKQSLLDQKFKTETTPLERTRFEMELTEARSRAKRAEEKAKQAEKELARLKKAEKAAARVKDLESQLAWARKQSQAHLTALGAVLEKVKALEAHRRRRYRKPSIQVGKGKRSHSKPQPSSTRAGARSKHRWPVGRS